MSKALRCPDLRFPALPAMRCANSTPRFPGPRSGEPVWSGRPVKASGGRARLSGRFPRSRFMPDASFPQVRKSPPSQSLLQLRGLTCVSIGRALAVVSSEKGHSTLRHEGSAPVRYSAKGAPECRKGPARSDGGRRPWKGRNHEECITWVFTGYLRICPTVSPSGLTIGRIGFSGPFTGMTTEERSIAVYKITKGPWNPAYRDLHKRDVSPWERDTKKACSVVGSSEQADKLLHEGETLIWLADGVTLHARSKSAKRKKVKRS